MVTLTRIYTRGGDAGQTSLGDGSRLPKHDLRIDAFGTVDEANAIIGLVRLHTRPDDDAEEGDAKGGNAGRGDRTADAILARIQNDLFDLGADLCTPEMDDPPYPPLRVTADQVLRLEREIDAINADLQPLNSFVLPGGTPAGAHLHQARTVVRRAERLVARLQEREKINPEAFKYLNRLSDLLFVLSRHVNDGGRLDILWVPGATR